MNLYLETFVRSVQKYPENIALWCEGTSFTYQALYQLSQQWANVIQQYNVELNIEEITQGAAQEHTSNFPVAIYGGKQWQMYTGILAVLAAKYTYVPLNNKQPTERNSAVLAQVHCQLMLVAQDEDPSELLALITRPLTVIYLGDDVPKWLAYFSPHRCLHMNSIDYAISSVDYRKPAEQLTQVLQQKYAYILFTSGSTGTPKGIAVSHDNVIRHIARISKVLGILPSDKVAQFFELSFDLSVHDLFSCWNRGAALYVIPTRQLFCPTNFIKQHQLTIFSAVASVLSFIDKLGLLIPNDLPSLRVSCFGGEKLLTKQALQWQACAHNSKVINLYGPTEFTITATYYQLDAHNPPSSTSVPIGKALSGLMAILVKDGQQVTTSNTLAELYLAGDQLVDGYWEDPKKTAQAFISVNAAASPLSESSLKPGRYYRTGDIVYFDEKHNLVFHGRNDHQFKVSGHRVEAADIESCILSYCRSITWCTVKTMVTGSNSQAQIVAFIESSKTIDYQELRTYCLEKLPLYMVPDKLSCSECLPRNASGKVDVKVLSKPFTVVEKEWVC